MVPLTSWRRLAINAQFRVRRPHGQNKNNSNSSNICLVHYACDRIDRRIRSVWLQRCRGCCRRQRRWQRWWQRWRQWWWQRRRQWWRRRSSRQRQWKRQWRKSWRPVCAGDRRCIECSASSSGECQCELSSCCRSSCRSCAGRSRSRRYSRQYEQLDYDNRHWGCRCRSCSWQ